MIDSNNKAKDQNYDNSIKIKQMSTELKHIQSIVTQQKDELRNRAFEYTRFDDKIRKLTSSLKEKEKLSKQFQKEIKINKIELEQSQIEINQLKNAIIDQRKKYLELHNKESWDKTESRLIYYTKLYYSLESKLQKLLEWPLSLDKLANPTILPSGITITESYFNRLINQKDPYNKKLKVSQKICNRIAKDLQEIINESENVVFKEEKEVQQIQKQLKENRLLNSKETQTNFKIINKNFIHRISKHADKSQREDHILFEANLNQLNRKSKYVQTNFKFILIEGSSLNENKCIEINRQYNCKTLFNWIKRNPIDFFTNQASLFSLQVHWPVHL